MLELLAKNDPTFVVMYDDLLQLLLSKNRTLSVKTKEMVVAGILATREEHDALTQRREWEK